MGDNITKNSTTADFKAELDTQVELAELDKLRAETHKLNAEAEYYLAFTKYIVKAGDAVATAAANIDSKLSTFGG